MRRTDQQMQHERQRIREAYEKRDEDEASWFGHEDEAHAHRLAERYRLSRRLLASRGCTSLAGRRVLDIGCGDGHFLLELMQWGARPELLAGVDLRAKPLVSAHRRLPRTALSLSCASALPWPDEKFDLVSLLTVFSSILDPAMRRRVATEAMRVLAPDGAVLIYDSRRANPHNPDVRPLTREQLTALFPRLAGPVRSLTFLPHIARRLPAAWVDQLYPALAAVEPWRSHLLALLGKPPEVA